MAETKLYEARDCPVTLLLVRFDGLCQRYDGGQCEQLNADADAYCCAFKTVLASDGEMGCAKPCPACDAAWAQGKPVEGGGDGADIR